MTVWKCIFNDMVKKSVSLRHPWALQMAPQGAVAPWLGTTELDGSFVDWLALQKKRSSEGITQLLLCSMRSLSNFEEKYMTSSNINMYTTAQFEASRRIMAASTWVTFYNWQTIITSHIACMLNNKIQSISNRAPGLELYRVQRDQVVSLGFPSPTIISPYPWPLF